MAEEERRDPVTDAEIVEEEIEEEEEEEYQSTPFDHPFFLPVLLIGFGVLAVAAIYYTWRAVRERREADD